MKPVVYLTRVIGGQLVTKKIEGEDAMLVLASNGFSLLPEKELSEPSLRGGAVCPECGTRATTFQKTGRFGCPSCYQHFLPYIGDLLRKMHEGTVHLGKLPRTIAPEIVKAKRMKIWQTRLNDMVARENYEEAAVVRDEIARLHVPPSPDQP